MVTSAPIQSFHGQQGLASSDYNTVKSATCTLEVYETLVFLDTSSATFTITLPPAAEAMGRFIVMETIVGGNDITYQVGGDCTLQGSATASGATAGDWVIFFSNGRDWLVCNANAA